MLDFEGLLLPQLYYQEWYLYGGGGRVRGVDGDGGDRHPVSEKTTA